MKRLCILAIVLTMLTFQFGCQTRRTQIRTETETTEKVIEEKVVDPGDTPAEKKEDENKLKTETRTETKERVVEKKIIVQ